MNFPVAAYVLALAAAFFTVAASLPGWRKLCFRIGLVDDPGHRKIHDRPIPLAGGLAVMTGLLLPALAAALWVRLAGAGAGGSLFFPFDSASLQRLLHGLDRRGIELGAIFIGGLGMLGLGVWDDQRELRPGVKFAGQLLIALLVAASGARVKLFLPNIFFSYAATVLWILTIINALNFMDNMNGLCAGLGIIGSFYFAVISAGAGQYLVALTAFLTAGALLGFLPYNFPRAKAFLGDAGSHLTGYLLAVLAILPHFYTPQHPRVLAVFSPLLILAVPLGDLAWVVMLRWRMGKPFYVGDTNHLSHRLVRHGYSPAEAVVAIWVIAALIGSFALLLR